MRLVALLFSMLVVATVPTSPSAKAEYVKNSKTTMEGWEIRAFTNDSTGEFSHCAVSSAYRGGVMMFFSVSEKDTWRVGWIHPDWHFQKDQDVDISVHVDDRGPYNLRGVAISKEAAAAELPRQSSVFDVMRRGNRVTVYAAGTKHTFNLNGTSAALTEVLACTGRYSGVASAPASPTPPPAHVPSASNSHRPGSVTAEQRLEATKIVGNILARGDLKGFKLLTAEEVADLKSESLSKSDVVWLADEVAGTLRIIPKSNGMTARDITTSIVADDLKNCKGQSASSSTTDKRNSAVIRLFTGCQDGKDTFEYRYTVVPLDNGAFYVFSTGAQSSSGMRNEAAKADLLLRDAVYDVLKK